MLGEISEEGLKKVYEDSVRDFEAGTILKGRILEVLPEDAVVDVGYKSEGVIPLKEFEQPEKVKVGDEIEVLLEAVEDDAGLIVISKQKAERLRGWQKIIAEHKEGDVVSGRVMRKIKGGLLVDIGVPVFLPASQVDLRRPGDIAEYVGKEVRCKILKIDQGRRNIVVSRRRLLEEERQRQKEALMAEIEVGQVRKGVVKNILDFGAFVDLGGIDGLLHITDMSWGRISHPSEMLKIDDEIEVKILKVDKEKERISLGLKQKTESPWARVEEKYPTGVVVKGEVVNVVDYGAFVKLEDGIEGLVHISEMSWTRRINHPSEVVAIGDIVEVMVLDISKEKEEISLGMKQTEVNPWTLVEEKYPTGTVVKGRVRNFTNYGAFVEIEEGIDGLLHVSDMSWTKKITHPSEVLKKGEKIDVVVLSVDQERKRVALGLKQLQEDPWEKEIPQKFDPGDILRGRVTKITNFGVFVELEKDLEGLLHISELSEKKVESPEEVVSVGDEVEVKVLRVDPVGRKIGLSLRRIHPEELAAFKAEEDKVPQSTEDLPQESSEGKEQSDPSSPEEA
ncbi:MAG: 30S ribosomal protein S1 [Planctomycetes bacterium DG_23]|nr:MAG: 30S ribosomal protein S1 [Planctomycetes bacterium DG_23]